MRGSEAVKSYISEGMKALRINYGALSGTSYAPIAGRRNYFAYFTPGTDIDYASLVGDVWHNSAVRACINAFQRARTETRAVVQMQDGEDWNTIDHALSEPLRTPNQQYSASQFWSGMELSWSSWGTAYAKVVRDNLNRPRELFYLPHKWVWPEREPNSKRLIDHYWYRPPGLPQERIEVPDMLQWQFGVNPDDPRFGMGFWDACLREIYTDHEAANYEANMLRNGGAGYLVSEKEGTQNALTDTQIERALDILRNRTARDKRGNYAYLDGALEVNQVGTNPDEMALELIRRIPETRICADCGLPAGWVGLMAGIERNTYNNSETDDRKAWNAICAYLSMQAEQTTFQLLNGRNYRELRSSGQQLRVWFDTSNVQALQPNKPEIWGTAIQAYQAGLITMDEARADMNLPLLRDLTPEQRTELNTQLQQKIAPPEPAGAGAGK